MMVIPTIRVKSKHQSQGKFVIKNADHLRYDEELFMADEFKHLGEHHVRLKIASLPSGDPFIIEGNLWLDIKAQEREESSKIERSEREIETLSIAKLANRIALYAIIIAITAIIVTNIDSIIKFLFSPT